MADVYDYLRWRGDVPFVADPFGEVDAMILSMLVYTKLNGIVEEGGKEKTLREVYDEYYRDRTPDDVRADKLIQPKSPLLLESMLSGGRFGDMTFSFYDDETVAERDMQFCAVTYRLSDGTAFVAFRGTDSTLTGWREDFDISFQSRTEGQLKAVSYLDRVGKALRVPLRVGGHSKGGNLAVFASAFCSPSVRRRIKAVYSFDGPGFPRETVETEEYRAVLGKTVSFIPDTSLIGQLLISETPREVVKSTAKGIGQHDALTWSIERNRFEKLLREIPDIRLLPTQANYFCIQLTGTYTSAELTKLLLARYNIMVKDCDSKTGLKGRNFIRISVRSEEDNNRLIAALKELMRPSA